MYTLIRLMPLFWQQPPPTISDRVKKQKMRSRKCFLLFWADFVYDLGYLITIKSCRGRTIKHTVAGRECDRDLLALFRSYYLEHKYII